MHKNARHPLNTRASACGFYAAPLCSGKSDVCFPHDPGDWRAFSMLAAEKLDARETLRRFQSERPFHRDPHLRRSLHKAEVSPREAS